MTLNEFEAEIAKVKKEQPNAGEKTKTTTPEIVVCEHNAHMPNLTKGKPYEIISRDENKIVIVDDSGRKNSYYASRFISRKLELA